MPTSNKKLLYSTYRSYEVGGQCLLVTRSYYIVPIEAMRLEAMPTSNKKLLYSTYRSYEVGGHAY